MRLAFELNMSSWEVMQAGVGRLDHGPAISSDFQIVFTSEGERKGGKNKLRSKAQYEHCQTFLRCRSKENMIDIVRCVVGVQYILQCDMRFNTALARVPH